MFQVLLDLARMIFEEQSTIEHMVFRILTHTQSLIQCQRVQVKRNFLQTGVVFVAAAVALLQFFFLVYFM